MPSPTSRPGDKRGWSLLAPLLLSICLHLVLVPAVVWWLLLQDKEPMESARSTQAFELLTLREARDPTTPRPEEEEEEAEPPDRRRQHVALPAPDREERPEDADFADQYERSVERETVSPDDEYAPPEETTTPPPASAEAAPPERARERSPEERPEREPARQRVEERAERDPAAEDAPDQPRESAAQEAEEGAAEDQESEQRADSSERERRQVDFRAFNPTLDDVGEVGEARPRRQDYLDLPEGERTDINSIQSMYWSFFMRMRQALLQEWNPQRQLRLHDPTLALYGRRDRITVLEITLNSDGSLRHAIIARSSELDFLDQEAIRAFQAAQPFPNVPEGLKDERGHATLRFSFIVSFERNISRLRWEF